MNIKTENPKIALLRLQVEKSLDFPLCTHGDFVRLSAVIGYALREHMSESTLERVWEYSTRHYETVSVRTLNVLSRFAGFQSWDHFCKSIDSGCSDSELFSGVTLLTKDLKPGALVKIGWQPNRMCVVRYLGDNRFVAEKTENSTMQEGDTFSCLQFQKGRELYLDDFHKADPGERFRYVVGVNHGLTTLEVLDNQQIPPPSPLKEGNSAVNS